MGHDHLPRMRRHPAPEYARLQRLDARDVRVGHFEATESTVAPLDVRLAGIHTRPDRLGRFTGSGSVRPAAASGEALVLPPAPTKNRRKCSELLRMLSPEDIVGLPIEEYGFPGPLRDALVGAILDGRKTSTTSLVAQYLLDDEALPMVGDRGVVVDSSEQPVCVTEVTEVRVVPLAAVDVAHAIDEGEGYETVSDWRTGHEEFWHSPEFRSAMRDPNFMLMPTENRASIAAWVLVIVATLTTFRSCIDHDYDTN